MEKITHSFAVCAYGASPYLECCLRSLLSQTTPSEILLCTSTPNDLIRDLAERYGIPLKIRGLPPGSPRGIGADWNFAFSQASGTFVTLAHQDDIYGRHYTEEVLKAAARWPDMSLFFCSAVTIKNGRPQRSPGIPERIKTLLRLPLRISLLSGRTAGKRSILRFGNPVICPSIAYRSQAVEDASRQGKPFREDRKFILDWEFLYDFAAAGGRWICREMPLMLYRVHPGAATASCIADHIREQEERDMFRRLWPEKAADLLLRLYRSSYSAYS